MGLGLLLSALSGAGQGVGESLQSNQKYEQQSDLQNQAAELQAQKAIQVNAANLANQTLTADQQREQAAARIQAAASPYLQQATLKNAMADPDFVTRNASPDSTSAPIITAANLTADDLQKYAPTAQQKLAATIQGANDTGDIAPTGLLQSQLADQANARMVEMQANQIKASQDIAANQIAAQAAQAEEGRKTQVQVAGMYAGARNNGLDPAAQLSINLGQRQDAEAAQLESEAKAARISLAQGNIQPKNPDGTPNPDYAKEISSIQASITQANILRTKAFGFYSEAAKRAGLPVSDIMGASPSPSPSPSPAAGRALNYDPATGSMTPVIQANDPHSVHGPNYISTP